METNTFNQDVGPVTEAELVERSSRPRITKEALLANIVNETFYQHGLLTICVLDLKNGFTVTGESACADPANFMQDVGERLARTNAENKIWALMDYELKTKVALVEAGIPPSLPSMKTYIGTKAVHAEPMTRAAYNTLRGWELPADEDGDDEGYLVEYADEQRPNTIYYQGYVSWSPKDVFEKSYSLFA